MNTPETAARDTPRTALVTGATGFAGSVLARRLQDAGCKVRLLVRSVDKLQEKGLQDFDHVQGSVTEPETVDRAVAGVDTVFHLAAVYREGGLTDDVYREVHVRGTELICEAALRHGAQRLVHCSTVGVHGHIESPPADEDYRVSPGDIYQQTKWEGEQAAWRFHRENGLAVSVVRPTAIFGVEDERLLKLFRLANRNRVVILGDGEVHYHLVHVEDLVRGLVLAARIPEAVGEAFIIGGDGYLTLNGIISRVAAWLGKKGKILHLPVQPFQLAGTLCEKTLIPLGINPPIYRRRVDFFTKSRAFDISKAKRVLGYQPEVSTDEGLRQTAEAYRAEGLL